VESEEIWMDLRALRRHGWSVSALAREFPIGPSRRRAKELRAAVRNAGFEFPQRRVTVNLAPRPVGAPSGPTWRTCGPPRSPRTPCSVTRCPVLDGLIDSGVDLFGRYSESAIQDTRRHFHKS
jgi:hypothetical protein